MANTVVLDYTNALMASLAARAGLEGVVITDGPPEMSGLAHGEWIAFLDVSGSQEWATISRATKPRNETLTLEFFIDVVAPSGANNQTGVNARAVELFQEIEDELRSNPGQGVGRAFISSQVATEFRLLKRANLEEGWRECLLTAAVEVKARL